jgi:transcriptional regulator with XRE-family HTH domain
MLRTENRPRHLLNGVLFKKFREEVLKTTLRECADLLSVSHSHLSRIENSINEISISAAFAGRLTRLIKKQATVAAYARQSRKDDSMELR